MWDNHCAVYCFKYMSGHENSLINDWLYLTLIRTCFTWLESENKYRNLITYLHCMNSDRNDSAESQRHISRYTEDKHWLKTKNTKHEEIRNSIIKSINP
jgi:cytochrome c-type biogenesis protein CcmH/NrfF